MRLCSRTAVFGHPEVKFGAIPLYSPLVGVVGEGAARVLCWTGQPVPAAETLRMGLVSDGRPSTSTESRLTSIVQP